MGIAITDDLSIDEGEIEERFVLAGGPGGQHVNKTATAVQLRFDVMHSPSLPESVRERLLAVAGNRVNADGLLVVEAKSSRSQLQNRKQALEKLIALIRAATEKPKPRRATKPSRAAKAQRLTQKRRRGELKKQRRTPSGHED